MKELIEAVINRYEDCVYSRFSTKKLTFLDYNNELQAIREFSFLNFRTAGKSIENRPITAIEFGKGPTKILIWTQMHGNESTATRALFDFFTALNAAENIELRNLLSNELQVLFLPMLNPDGAERYQRRNALNIDPNRDAKKRVTPEIQTLFKIIEDFAPHWCFNMHDQRNLFNVSSTNKPATISFLSPSTSPEDGLSKGQEEAMQLIATVASNLSSVKDVGIARFSHEYYPTATGDNIQAMGYRTILVESGGYRNDPNRMIARKVVFESFFRSFAAIASESWKKGRVKHYLSIPMNDKKLFDLLIRNVRLAASSEIRTDVGIEISETFDPSLNQVLQQSSVKDIGDLSHHYGYDEVDGSNGYISMPISLNQKADFDILFEKTTANKSTIFVRNGYVQ